MDTLYTTSINENTTLTISKLDEISSEQFTWNKNNSWSVLQILEHIYLTDKVIFHMISQPSENISDNKEIVGENKLQHILVNKRATKVQAPDVLSPKNQFTDYQSFRDEFLALRNEIVEAISSEKLIVDNRIHKHFILGDMTILDWLHFIIHHTERHLIQVDEIINQ